MHRFLPALFKMNSGEIYNVPVADRKRERGVSKYSFNNRFWIGVSDLIKVRLMILKRRKI
jgi:dolichol-phosphate mannosyltransferase